MSEPDSKKYASLVEERAVWRMVFILMIALSLVPVWLFDFFPTQDGPIHISIADELSRIGQGSTIDDYFVTNWQFQTYNFIFVVLTGLLPYFSALTAEKILVSGYVSDSRQVPWWWSYSWCPSACWRAPTSMLPEPW